MVYGVLFAVVGDVIISSGFSRGLQVSGDCMGLRMVAVAVAKVICKDLISSRRWFQRSGLKTLGFGLGVRKPVGL